VVTVVVGVALALLLLVPGSQARPGDTVTLDLQAIFSAQPALDVLVPNFERVYPNVEVSVTYTPNFPTLYQLETTELGAGNAPALLETMPGCGTPIAICVLAKAGNLAPMVKKAWVRWSIPLVTSLNKYDSALYASSPTVTPFGIYTNDDLFRKLGLKVPQDFSQLLDLCQKAKADGTVAIILDGGSQTNMSVLLRALAVTTVYAKDRQWGAEQRAGKLTFDGAAGWHQALQMFIDMSNAGCFQSGNAGTMAVAAIASSPRARG
jgi:raffinose/stachyose/melibiose transport system substrate-binding protein